jgi:hypothetical protein
VALRLSRVPATPSASLPVLVAVDPLRPSLGQVPALAACCGLGLLSVAAADALSRSTVSSSQALFWIGLLVIFVPITLRLLSEDARPGERVALVVLLGLSLYLVKVLRDPFGFTFPDEFMHAFNANAIARTHRLFNGGNSILPVTARYPGLEGTTAAVSAVTGLSTYGAGLIVIGAARSTMMVGLYALFERLSGSSRVGGIGAAVYAANTNFVFFSAQFSYESLALPLLVMILAAVAERQASNPGPDRKAWSIPIVVGISAVVVTHHLTSYAVVIVLLALSFGYWLARRRLAAPGLWLSAAFAFVATAGWLLVVARTTIGYLVPPIVDAFNSTIHTLSGEAAPRRLFTSDSGLKAPLLERVVGIASVLLMAAGLPFGLVEVWRRHRRNPFAIMFSLAAVAFFGTLLLRFAPSAWETGNRAGEFLFLGVAFVLALARPGRLLPLRAFRPSMILACACLAVIFCGGAIAGWPPNLRLSLPYRVSAGSRLIEPAGLTLAQFAGAQLGHDQRFAASESDARLLLLYAREFPLSGSKASVETILTSSFLPSWELPSLRRAHVRYVAVDLRARSFDNAAGYFFRRPFWAGDPDPLIPSGTASKFDRIGASRIYDSGTILVYDLRSARA